jgi:hypothetical protein
MGQIFTTSVPLSGGVVGAIGTSRRYRLALQNSWVEGDEITFLFTSTATGSQLLIGAGSITSETPGFCLTLNRKEYIAAGAKLFFSSVDSPLTFNTPLALGNGFIALANNYSMSEDLQSFAPYQGKMAIFGRNHIQIWQIDADPGNYQQLQVLDGIGTLAPDSVKALGELDVFFLHDTGIRSLRARDSSSNAYSLDIGSPIDSLVKTKLAESSSTERAAACGVIDPNNSQYWLFIKNKLYVLSIFPSAKISAWSTWDCTYQVTAGVGVTITNNNYFTSITYKAGIENDPATATHTGFIGELGTSAVLSPFKYLWIYASDTLIDSFVVTDGLLFSGNLVVSLGVMTQTAKQTAFTPQKFVNYNGQVFVSTSEGFYVYGGADNVTYDNTICVSETSWLDFDSPAVQKSFGGVDVAQEGTWNHYASPDYLSQTFQEIMLAQDNPTFAGGKIGWTNTGTHVKFRSQTNGNAERCVLSNVLIHYKGNQNSK